MRRRGYAVAAVGVVVSLPLAAYFSAPAQARAASAPAVELAGFNTASTSAAARVEFFVPGLVPVGDATQGNFVQASMPFASSTATTGPATGGVASPVWPGDAAANAGNALQTFNPSIPVQLVHLLNDPVVARSDYPPQVGAGTSGSFAPTGPAGVGSARTTSSASQTVASAALSDFAPVGGSGKSGVPLVEIASATSATAAVVDAGSVATSAVTRIGQVRIAGVVTIGEIDTTAGASSNGQAASPVTTTDISGVTVAGVAASIGPDGITLNRKSQGSTGTAVAAANQILSSLEQAGITVRTIAPTVQRGPSSADATSGALVVSFEDANPPNIGELVPQLPIPQPNSVGVTISLGLSSAGAAATRLPTGSTGSIAASGGPLPNPGRGPLLCGPGCPSSTTGSRQAALPSSNPPVLAPQHADVVFGVPVRVAWVVVALLIAVLAAGPLLMYANWQLLRGRSP
jgi:hypothetical protein